MAKLSAHGKELARVEKEYTLPDRSELITWERITVVLMSDGKMLKKRDVRFKPNPNLGETKPQPHSYGWTLHGYGSGEFSSLERFVAAFEKVGYRRVG